MTVEIIDLTGIKPIVSQKLLDLEFTYDTQSSTSLLQQTYRKQKLISDAKFDEWVEESNSTVIKEFIDFINESVDRKKCLFQDSLSNLLHSAVVVLGPHAGDHSTTLQLIRSKIRKRFSKVTIVDIGLDATRRSVTELIDEHREYENILFMIEHTERLDYNLSEIIIQILYNMLQDRNSMRIMIAFIVSAACGNIDEIVPCDKSNRMHRCRIIVKDSRDILARIQSEIIENKNMLFKLGSKVVSFIYYSALVNDESLTNLKYLYELALLTHCLNDYTLLTQDRNLLKKHFKDDPFFVNIVLELESTKHQPPKTHDPTELSNYCHGHVQKLLAHHDYVMRQIRCYYYLIRDETKMGNFSEMNEIYCELMNYGYEHLGQSSEIIDAIKNVRLYPRERILKRIHQCTSSFDSMTPIEFEKRPDILTILIEFGGKMENNDCSKKIVLELVNCLLDHVRHLTNPCFMPLYEAVYFMDDKNLARRSQPSTRIAFLRQKPGQSSYFSKLLNLILYSTEEICLNDLYNDFKALFQDDAEPAQRKKVEKANIKIKTTVKKASRVAQKSNETSEKLQEGLLKAIFCDVIDTMEHQGIVKKDNRISKRGMLRRLVWPLEIIKDQN